MASDSYSKATQILRTRFPARATADDIVDRKFPAFGAADRIVAGAGLIPQGTRGGKTGGGRGSVGPLAGNRRGTYPGPRIPRGPAERSVAADLIAQDADRAAQDAAEGKGGAAVDIRVWAAKLQQAGVAGETIFAAYDAAGGDAELSAQQQAGATGGFLADFVGGLEDQGVAPEVVLGTYQQAGGRIGR